MAKLILFHMSENVYYGDTNEFIFYRS